jgi:hypothetical protein
MATAADVTLPFGLILLAFFAVLTTVRRARAMSSQDQLAAVRRVAVFDRQLFAVAIVAHELAALRPIENALDAVVEITAPRLRMI